MDKRLVPENTSEKSISSDISMKVLKQYKVQISNSSARRSNGNHLEESLKTSLEDPCTLKIHFAGEKSQRSIFDRNDIIANADHGATLKSLQNISYKGSEERKSLVLAEEIHSPQSRKRTSSPCYSTDSHSLDDGGKSEKQHFNSSKDYRTNRSYSRRYTSSPSNTLSLKRRHSKNSKESRCRSPQFKMCCRDISPVDNGASSKREQHSYRRSCSTYSNRRSRSSPRKYSNKSRDDMKVQSPYSRRYTPSPQRDLPKHEQYSSRNNNRRNRSPYYRRHSPSPCKFKSSRPQDEKRLSSKEKQRYSKTKRERSQSPNLQTCNRSPHYFRNNRSQIDKEISFKEESCSNETKQHRSCSSEHNSTHPSNNRNVHSHNYNGNNNHHHQQTSTTHVTNQYMLDPCTNFYPLIPVTPAFIPRGIAPPHLIASPMIRGPHPLHIFPRPFFPRIPHPALQFRPKFTRNER